MEVVEEALPHAALSPNFELPNGWQGVAPVYRLTEAGWHVINRTHAWTIAIFVVAIATLMATVIGIAIQTDFSFEWPGGQHPGFRCAACGGLPYGNA